MSLDQADPAALPAAGPATRKSGRAAGGAAGRRGHDRRAGRWWTPWLFLAPALLLFLYFKFIPMVSALTMSFQDVQPYLGNKWVGTENYSTVLQSDGFREAAWHTVVLAAGQTAARWPSASYSRC